MEPEESMEMEAHCGPMVWKILVAALLGIIGLILLGLGIWDVYLANKSSAWPSVEGIIKTSRVHKRRVQSKRGSRYEYTAKVLYGYSVDEQQYDGERIAFGYGSKIIGISIDNFLGFFPGSGARRIVERYPEGKVLGVHYKPGSPGVCVLEPGIRLTYVGQWYKLVAGIAFIVAGAVGFFKSGWRENLMKVE